jgi:hypothetical protein
VKKHHDESEIQALAAARARARLPIAIAVLLALLQLFVAPDFLGLHCVVLMALAALTGYTCAQRVFPARPDVARRAGSGTGMMAAAGYIAPFIIAANVRLVQLSPATAAARANALSQAERDFIAAAGDRADLIAYFTNQDISYVFGYLVFGILVGALLGSVGGAWALRRSGLSGKLV